MKPEDQIEKQNTRPPLTIYSQKENKTINYLVQELTTEGLKLHFEFFDFRPHLTVEVQRPTENYEYEELFFKDKKITRHNNCRITNYGPENLWGKEFHQIQTRFWAPRILTILKHPEYFKAKYTRKSNKE